MAPIIIFKRYIALTKILKNLLKTLINMPKMTPIEKPIYRSRASMRVPPNEMANLTRPDLQYKAQIFPSSQFEKQSYLARFPFVSL